MSTFGWKKVFKFTFVQNIKSKSFIISTIIISVLMLAGILLIGLLPAFMAGDNGAADGVEGTEFSAKTVYLVDTTGITASADYKIIADRMHAEFVASDNEADAAVYSEKVMTGTESLFVSVSKSEDGIDIYAGVPQDSSVPTDEAQSTADVAAAVFQQQRLVRMGLSAEQTVDALAPVSTEVSVVGEKAESGIILAIKIAVPMICSLILFILIFAYGQLVAQSIAQEKTSRVMELLLTSVRPLAVIIGKILAMGALSLLQFMVFVVAGFIGAGATLPMTGVITGSSKIPEDLTELTDALGEVFSGFSVFSVIGVLVVFLIGFIFYALIAGLVGASVSRTEDLNSAMQPYAIIGVVGFYLAYFPKSFGGDSADNAMQLVSYFLPLSSPFSLPSALITGELSPVMAVLAIAVLTVCTVLMAILVARVYEQVIFHTGNRMKFSDILGLVKDK